MKILLTGSNGMLGSSFIANSSHNIEWAGVDISQNRHLHIPFFNTDLCDPVATAKTVDEFQPECIIHTAAYTDVDGCEKNPADAQRLNVTVTKHISEVAKKNNAFLVLISTDYVFSGNKKAPYTESDPTDPISVYGQTKLDAEKQVQSVLPDTHYIIVRTSWLYGANKRNFVETILDLSERQKELRIPSDHIGRPTYTDDLAGYILDLVSLFHESKFRKNAGIVNVANSGETSWFDFANEILKRENKHIPVIPIQSLESGRAARRPSYSVLDLTKFETLTGKRTRDWKVALADYLSKRRKNV